MRWSDVYRHSRAVIINHCAFCFYVRQLRIRWWSFWLLIVCVSQCSVCGHHHPPHTIDLLRISVHIGKTGRTGIWWCRVRFFIPHMTRFRWCPADTARNQLWNLKPVQTKFDSWKIIKSKPPPIYMYLRCNTTILYDSIL